MLLKKFLKNRADDEKEEEVSLEELKAGQIYKAKSDDQKDTGDPGTVFWSCRRV